MNSGGDPFTKTIKDNRNAKPNYFCCPIVDHDGGAICGGVGSIGLFQPSRRPKATKPCLEGY